MLSLNDCVLVITQSTASQAINVTYLTPSSLPMLRQLLSLSRLPAETYIIKAVLCIKI